MNRRNFLCKSAGLLLGAGLMRATHAAPAISIGSMSEFAPPSFDLTQGARSVNWFRPAVKESLSLTYMIDGKWLPGAYDKLCYLLRDVNENKAVQMDPQLIAILDWTQVFLKKYGYTDPIHILSGYRTQRTNARLENASKRSQHLLGKAVDIRVPGVPVEYLGKLFRWLAQGGVGVYGDTKFVHIDTGQVRAWRE